MAAVQKGRAVIWGCNGITFVGGIVEADDAADKQSMSYTKDSDKAYIPDGNGDTAGRVDYNHKKTITITVIPNGGTVLADAQAALSAYMPDAGTVVEITDSDGDAGDEHQDGDDHSWWLVNRATQNRSNTGPTTIELELEQFKENNVAAATTA